jgi:hypothetical protein
VATANVLNEGMPGDNRSGADVGLQTTHRSQPSFQLGMISFDPVIGITLDAMPRLGKHLFEYPQIAGGLVGHHFDRRHDGGGQGTVKEPPSCAAVVGCTSGILGEAARQGRTAAIR